MKRFISAFLIVVSLGLAVGAAYVYGVTAGENRVLDTLQITNLEEHDGKYSVIFHYRDRSRLSVYYPWWLYAKK